MRVIKHQPWTPFFYTPCIVCKFERISFCAYVRSDKGKITTNEYHFLLVAHSACRFIIPHLSCEVWL